MKELIGYARRFIGVSYYFGGEHPSRGFDCSGYVQELLAFAGVDPAGDQSAQALHDYFVLNALSSEPGPGALVFYGPSVHEIKHVEMMTSNFSVIGAMGGTSEMIGQGAKELAIEKKAFVKERPINRRKDIVAIMMPRYPDWIVNS